MLAVHLYISAKHFILFDDELMNLGLRIDVADDGQQFHLPWDRLKSSS
ncbi:hypothetical protein [Companilactobacillus sp. HBUAS59699]